MKKYLFGLIIRFVLVLIMLSSFFVKQDSRIIKTITFHSVLLIWIFLAVAFKHPQTAGWDKTEDIVGEFLLSIFLHLFPFCFLFINIFGSLVLFELPDKLLVYFSKGNKDVVLNILNATFWGNTLQLIWGNGNTCDRLFCYGR